MFGFGKGKINISIQKTYYAPGDLISGNVALTLKKPVKAREVSISLIGEEITTGWWRHSRLEWGENVGEDVGWRYNGRQGGFTHDCTHL
jgi:hypothetical protein